MTKTRAALRHVTRLAAVAAAPLAFCLAFSAAPSAAQPIGQPPPDRGPDLSYLVVDGAGVPDPLSEQPGDAARGRDLFSDPAGGNCASCHSVGGEGGDAGPALDDVGRRLPESAIRLWIINPSVLKEDAGMPAYYTLASDPPGGPPREAPPLSAEQIEDLVAYLDGLATAPPSASSQ